MGGVGDLFRSQRAKIHNMKCIVFPHANTVVRGTSEDRLVFLGPYCVHACPDLALYVKQWTGYFSL